MATLTLNPDEPLKNDNLKSIYNIKDKTALSDLYQMMKSRLGRKKHAATQSVADDGDSKEYILAGIKNACRDLKLIREGKVRGVEVHEFLRQFDDED